VAALVSTRMFALALLEARVVALHEVAPHLHHDKAGGEHQKREHGRLHRGRRRHCLL
jgi:hypothetical protein